MARTTRQLVGSGLELLDRAAMTALDVASAHPDHVPVIHRLIGDLANCAAVFREVARLLPLGQPVSAPNAHRWERLSDPPDRVKAVRLIPSGGIARRLDHRYWQLTGWPNGVDWAQVLRWGPVEEVKDDGGVADHRGGHTASP